MKIKINKLFGKYNTEINLNERCTIFIGENGIGKSTTLKIIENIIKGQYNQLIKYKFESIDIDNYHIVYEDLIPSKHSIIEYYRKIDIKNDVDNILDEFGCTKENYIDDYGISINEELSDFFNEFNSSEYSDLIRSITNNKMSISFERRINSYIEGTYLEFASNAKELINNLKPIVKQFVEDHKTNFYQKEELFDLINDSHIFNNKVVSLNMVRDYKITNDTTQLIENDFDNSIKESFFDKKKKEFYNKPKIYKDKYYHIR